MNPLKKATRRGITVMLVLGFVMLSGCAQYAVLKSNPVVPARAMESEAANKTYNALRFESFGPYMEQIYGYLLYGEGMDVVWDGTGYFRLGKMNLKEAVADYEKNRLQKGWYAASPPIISEVFRDNKLIGYTLRDFMLDVNVWEDLEASKEANKVILRIYYQDRRKLDTDGDNVRERNKGR
jgi:hypothetical protein